MIYNEIHQKIIYRDVYKSFCYRINILINQFYNLKY